MGALKKDRISILSFAFRLFTKRVIISFYYLISQSKSSCLRKHHAMQFQFNRCFVIRKISIRASGQTEGHILRNQSSRVLKNMKREPRDLKLNLTLTLEAHAGLHVDKRVENEDIRRGRMVAAASRRHVEIQYRKSEHTYLPTSRYRAARHAVFVAAQGRTDRNPNKSSRHEP